MNVRRNSAQRAGDRVPIVPGRRLRSAHGKSQDDEPVRTIGRRTPEERPPVVTQGVQVSRLRRASRHRVFAEAGGVRDEMLDDPSRWRQAGEHDQWRRIRSLQPGQPAGEPRYASHELPDEPQTVGPAVFGRHHRGSGRHDALDQRVGSAEKAEIGRGRASWHVVAPRTGRRIGTNRNVRRITEDEIHRVAQEAEPREYLVAD